MFGAGAKHVTWKRSLWMRLAALSNLVAVGVWLYVSVIQKDFFAAAQWRLASQIQFMHGMATFSSATFMNIGARSARHAPGFFLVGSALFCLAQYVEPAGIISGIQAIEFVGMSSMLIGWFILGISAREIDLKIL